MKCNVHKGSACDGAGQRTEGVTRPAESAVSRKRYESAPAALPRCAAGRLPSANELMSAAARSAFGSVAASTCSDQERAKAAVKVSVKCAQVSQAFWPHAPLN